MKQLKEYIIEKLHISNYKKEKEEEINLKIFTFKNDFVNVDLKDCNDDDFNEVVNSVDGIYRINFEVNGYGEFYGIINIHLFNGIKINLNKSKFIKGDYNFWLDKLNNICDEYLGGLKSFGWKDDLLNELKHKIK